MTRMVKSPQCDIECMYWPASLFDFHVSEINIFFKSLDMICALTLLVDRPTQLICISDIICQQTNTKDIAGQSALMLISTNDCDTFFFYISSSQNNESDVIT